MPNQAACGGKPWPHEGPQPVPPTHTPHSTLGAAGGHQDSVSPPASLSASAARPGLGHGAKGAERCGSLAKELSCRPQPCASLTHEEGGKATPAGTVVGAAPGRLQEEEISESWLTPPRCHPLPKPTARHAGPSHSHPFFTELPKPLRLALVCLGCPKSQKSY